MWLQIKGLTVLLGLVLLAGLGVMAQPVVNLGADKYACDQVVLDAGNAGAGYVWSTGASTQTLTVTTSGIYWVDVTNGSGTSRDSVGVTIVGTPAAPVVNDTSVCGGATFNWSSNGNNNNVVWYTSSSGSNIRAVGKTIALNPSANLTLYPQAINHSPIQKVGITTPSALTQSTQVRGLIFDALAPITIHSVLVSATATTTATIQLKNSSNVIIASTVVTIPGNLYQITPVRVPLYFDVPTGTNYQLVATLSGNLGFKNTGVTFPYTLPNLMSIKSAQDGSTINYNYFFDWEVTPQICKSTRGVSVATVLPTPVFNLGSSQEVVCGTTKTLNAFSSGSTYLWNTGSTDSAIIVSQSGAFTVVANKGGCTTKDSINLLFYPSAVKPVVFDTTVCTGTSFTLKSSSTNNTTIWRRKSDNLLIGVGDSINYSIQAPTELLVQGANLSPSLPLGMITFQQLTYLNQLRGLLFDVFEPMMLESVVVYDNQISDITIYLENSVGQRLASQRVVLPAAINQPQRVPLYFYIQAGTNYKLMVQVNSGAIAIPNSASISYPYVLQGTASINNSNNNVLASYGYLFDWRVRRGSCLSVNDTVLVNTLPSPVLELGPDTLICGSGPLVLNVGQPGATYLWSTGSTDSTIAVTTDGVYGVQVSIGVCTANDQLTADFLDAALTPSVNDTIVCAGTAFVLRSNTPNSSTVWRNKITSQILGVADTLLLTVQDSVEVTVQGVSLSGSQAVGMSTFQAINYVSDPRGLLFDAQDDFILQSVVLYSNLPSTGIITLQNAALQTIASQAVSIPGVANQAYRVPLYFSVPKGQNYRLLLQITSGVFGIPNSVSISYPYTIPGLVSINNSANSVSASYGYLFDWRVSAGGCFSTLDNVKVRTLLSPVANLGRDTLVCGVGPLVLNVGQTGASYLWSTGSIDSTITVVNDGTYGVKVDIGICSSTDQIKVDFLPEALEPQLNDTLVCANIPFVLKSQTPNPKTLWRDLSNNQIIGVGDSVQYTVADSSIITAQGISLSPSLSVGISAFQALVFVSDTRGLLFNAQENFILESVVLYGNQPATGVIYLQNAALQTIASQSVSISGVANQPYRIPLFFNIPKGQNYRLMLQVTSGVFAVPNSVSISYPYTIQNLVSITNSANGVSASYGYLFDWRVSIGGCFSAPQPVLVNTLPSPVFDLGPDTLVCGNGPLILDVSQSGATYLWSDGSTQGIFPVLLSDTVSVKVNLGVCQIKDTLIVDFLPEAETPIVNDTTVCGGKGVSVLANSANDMQLWYLLPSGGSISGVGSSFTRDFTDTSTVYVQGVNSGPVIDAGRLSPGFLNYSSLNHGFRFDALSDITIQYVTIYSNVPSSFNIVLRNGQNQVISTSAVSTKVSGGQATVIPLFLDIRKGSNYRLQAENIIGSIGFSSGSTAYPYLTNGLISINSDEVSSSINYYYFYKIVISKGVCRSPLVPVKVDVKYPITFSNDIYSCDAYPVSASSNNTGTYLWSTGANTNAIVLDTSGVYSVQITDASGCIVRDTLTFDRPVNAGLPNDGILCGQALTTNYGAGAVFEWSTGQTTPTIQVTSPGTYSVRVMEPRGCTLLDTINITGFDVFPLVDLGQDFSQCDSTSLNAGNQGLNYMWSTGEMSQMIKVVSSGTYMVTVTNSNGCATSDTILVFVPQRPQADFFIADTVINPSLQVSFLNLSTFGQFFWDFGDGTSSSGFNPFHTYPQPGNYCVSLIVEDQINGCGTDTQSYCFTLIRYPVGIEELVDDNWKVYPVPAGEILHISNSGLETEGITLSIWSANGQLIRTQQLARDITTVQRENLPAGIYFLIFEKDHIPLGRRMVEFR